jgi:RNA polymerase sigma factor (sigma-70 family)
LAARDGSDTEARRALEVLCGTYWEPLYAYLRHQGYSADEARDLIQGYFTVLLEKDFLADVDPAKGRFRSFLLVSLRHFVAHERDRARAEKRGGQTTILSLDVEGAERRFGLQSPAGMTPEEVFEQRWAVTIMNRALTRLRKDSAESGRAPQFEVLRQYLTSAEASVSYREAARELGMTEGAVKMAVHRLRQRFGQVLRAEVAETVVDPADVEDELRQLLSTVR